MHILLRRACVHAAVISVLLASGPSFAASAATGADGTLSLPVALAAAVRNHPALARFSHDRRAADARALQAGLRPNPELTLDLENFAGNGARQGADALEATLRLGLVLESGAKRETRRSAAREAVALVDADYALARLDVAAEATLRFIDVVEAQDMQALAERGLASAQDAFDAAERRVRAGATSSMERNRARIELERARLEVEHREHLLATRRRMLAAQWGEAEPTFIAARGDLLTLPPTPDDSVLFAQLRRSPDFARFDIEQRLRDTELAQARTKSRIDPVLGAGLRRFEDSGDVAVVASLLVPLPLSNRNQGGIAEAEALRQRVDVERRASAVRAEAALYELVQELHHARTQVEALRGVLLPQAAAAATLAQRGYASGRYSQLDLIDAQRTRLELESELLSACADYHRALAAVERMTALAPPASP